MSPRLRLRPEHLRIRIPQQLPSHQPCRHASLATATTPAPPIEQTIHSSPLIARYPPTQPPSYKPPEFRKSQLHRQYASLLRSSPLMILFQHNNLRSVEWVGIRRELAAALRKVDESLAADGRPDYFGDGIKLQVIQKGIFSSALKVVEFYHPEQQPQAPVHHPTDPATATSATIPDTFAASDDTRLTHGLSRTAYEVAEANRRNKKLKHGLEPLLSGPLVLVTFPTVSPRHLKAVFEILAPNKEFPAPKRKTNPGYHEPAVQSGLQKLMMLGARVEGKVFDMEGARWVGSIEGGLDGLRAQLVAMLQGVGAGITNTLESAGKTLYFTMEGRRGMLEDEQRAQAGETPKEG
ncbi:hypothetical protein BJ546DRAFT_844585 [Cryomyces antarcticus]